MKLTPDDLNHPSNDLSLDEIASYKPLRLRFQTHRKGEFHFGISLNWHGYDCWRISIRFVLADLNLTYLTFQRYERNLKLRGPFRNA